MNFFEQQDHAHRESKKLLFLFFVAVVAIVVGIVDLEKGIVDLTLFPNWSRDGFVSRASALPQPVGFAWRQAVEYDERESAGTWHLPPFAKPKPVAL